MKAKISLPKKLIPLFLGDADVRASHGGRGSGKTRSFAKMTAVRGYQKAMNGESGIILCGRQFQNSLDDSSLGEVKAAIQEEEFLLDFYEIGERFIRSKDGRISYSFSGLERNINSIKSKSRVLLSWIDEAEPVTDSAWQILIPTIREEESELWVTWNPARKSSPCESRFRHANDPLIKCVEMNWRDNPWFPDKLERERLRDQAYRPDSYEHIWEGGYITAVTGAYFAKHLSDARAENRIGNVRPDPLMKFHLFADIGGTGAKADAFVFWVSQIIGKEIRLVDYYEVVGQPIDAHLSWMRSRGYVPEKSQIWLPHDGVTNDKVYSVSYQSSFEAAGYNVEIVPNQGKGAAMLRVEAARRWLGSCFFDAEKTEAGLEALGAYHEKRDELRDIGLGPDHDWSSHACFVGDTEVLTRYGIYRIIDLPFKGEVLTSCGWKEYVNPRITRKNAQLVEVKFKDGLTVKCTPDHLFKTASGWKSAASLTTDSEILSTLTKSLNTSMVDYIDYGHQKNTYQGAVKNYIVKSGGRHLEKFQADVIYTIKTAMLKITDSKILSAFLRSSTLNTKTINQDAVNSLTLLGIERQNGIGQMKGDYGTKDMLKEHRAGQSGGVRRNLVCHAINYLWRLLGKAETRRYTVQENANPTHIGNVLKIDSVILLEEMQDVWCITVPDAGEFSLSNGAVVHNCDAFGLMCVVVEDLFVKPKKQEDHYVEHISWMG